MSTRRYILVAALALTGLFAANTYAQDTAKGKGMTFHGKVEAITPKGLTVNGEKLEGWMDAMTYPVDEPDVLKKVKVGDRVQGRHYPSQRSGHAAQARREARSRNER